MGSRWSKERIIKVLAEYHQNWFEHDRDKTDFDFRYIRRIDSSLEKAIYSKIGSLKRAFELAGINPYCHLKQIGYDRTNKEKAKSRFIQLLEYIASEFGVETLNDRNMNSGDTFLPPDFWTGNRSYPLCERLGCPLKPITFRSVYAQGRRLFGDWESAVKAAGYSYDSIRRKKPKYPREAVIRDLWEFDRHTNGQWYIRDLREKNHALYHAIYNSHKDSIFLFANWPPVPTAYLELQYLRHKANVSTLTPKQFFKIEGQRIREQFERKHRAQQSWSRARLRVEVLRRFAAGVRLTRSAMEHSKNRDDRTLLASLRRYYGGDYKKALRDCGVDLDQLIRIYREMDDPFPPERVRSEIRRLLLESIQTGELRLSRKSVSYTHLTLPTKA